MSNDYSFVITKKIGDVVNVYVRELNEDMMNKLQQLKDGDEFKHYSVKDNKVETESPVMYSSLKSKSDNSSNDTTSLQVKDVTKSIKNGGKERKRKGKTHKKVKKGGMKTIKIWRQQKN